MSKENVTRRISIFVNDKEVENSLKGVEGAISHVRNKMRLLNQDSETYDQDSKELAKTMTQLREKQEQYRQELGLTQKAMKETDDTVSNFRNSISNLWNAFLVGDTKGIKEGLSGIKSELWGLVKASAALIVSPIGLLITALAGFGIAAKAIFDFNVGLASMNKELRALGVNASEISKVRDEISATAETFDKEFKEIAEKANSLSKTYGISMSEANRIIAEGLASGGAQNKEFLDSIGEYDEFFAKAGYSAKEFVDIVNTGYDLGIYADKLPDALKEADLALKENTKSTRDALVNAFGASFSDEILNRVKTGEITTKQALEEIAKKSDEVGLSQQQNAQLTADVFKGAGEDAGGAQKIFEAISKSTQRELDETAKASLNLLEANEKLNKAQAELFEIENFSDVWTNIKASAMNAFASALTYIAELKQNLQPLIDLVVFGFAGAWEYVKMIFTSVFDVIGGVLNSFGAIFKGLIQAIKKLIEGDFVGAFIAMRTAVYNAFRYLGNIFIDLQNNIIKFLQKMLDQATPYLKALGVNVDALKKKLEGLKGTRFEILGETKNTTTNETVTKPENNPLGSGGGGATADALKAEEKARADAAAKRKAAEEKEAKESYNTYKELADAKANLAKAQLDKYIFDLRSNLDKEKALTLEIIATETDRLAKIKDAQIKANNEELARKVADLEAKAVLEKTSQEVLNAEKEALNLEYQQKNQGLELDFQQQTDALKKQYEEEQAILKAEQLVLDNELALMEAETKAEENKLKQEQEYQEELRRYAKLHADKKITDEEYTRFKNAAAKRQDELDTLKEIEKTKATLGSLNSLSNALVEMFGQSKEMAIVQAGINGAMAITSIWAEYPKWDGGFAMYAALAAAGISTMAQIGKIAAAKPPKAAKFFFGGSTGTTAALGYDEFGPVTGYVHQNEYVIPEVMTQDPRFANTINWLEANRQQKLRGFVDGGSTSSTTAPSSDAPLNNEAQMVTVLGQLASVLSSGIFAKLILGYQDVAEIEKMKDELKSSSENGKVG